MNRKERRAAQRLGSGAGGAAFDQAQRLFGQALQYHQRGQFPEAERHYRSLLGIKPTHEHSLYNLGILALQTNRNDLAVEMLGKAVGINGGDAEWRYNYAFALQRAGRSEQAIEQYSRAVAHKPDYAEAHLNLGNLVFSLGRLAEATICYQKVAALKPDFAETHYNLGNVLAQQGRTQEAVACFERSLALKPLAETHNNLGIALAKDPARTDEAMAHYRKALALNPLFVEAENNIANLHAARGELEKAADIFGRIVQAHPNNADAYENLARTLLTGGAALAAVPVLAQALTLRETSAAKRLFVASVKQVRSGSDHPALRDLVVRSLTESWDHAGLLGNIVASLIKTSTETGGCVARAAQAWPRRLTAEELFGASGPDQVFKDRLLLAWLQTARVTDIEIERFLTMARSVLLRCAGGPAGGNVQAHELRFWSNLAQQCFANEFVFATTEDEVAAATRLRGEAAAALGAGEPVPVLQLLAIAALGRLDTLAHAARLLDHAWPDDVRAVLRQQLSEPREEQQLRASIPRLAPIKDDVSRRVQAQYEENPYPRWINVPRESPQPADEHRQAPFLHAPIRPYGSGIGTEVLIAGCGTGQHVVGIAQRYPQARILAIDLSMTSLGYAARKTRELGLTNVEYAQADILELGAVGRSFDVIESSGVLHHLGDPFAGWRVLLSVLRPRGYMHAGLYSELARQQIVAARRFIAERGYGSSVEDIRRCRQDLIEAATDGLLKEIADLGDFYTVSDCRDLLFHVQEHRLTLTRIKAFLEDAGLCFLGFDLEPSQYHAYARQFPDDKAMTNLAQWHVFEMQNPQTFIGMYQFWVQRSL